MTSLTRCGGKVEGDGAAAKAAAEQLARAATRLWTHIALHLVQGEKCKHIEKNIWQFVLLKLTTGNNRSSRMLLRARVCEHIIHLK